LISAGRRILNLLIEKEVYASLPESFFSGRQARSRAVPGGRGESAAACIIGWIINAFVQLVLFVVLFQAFGVTQL